jgi:hypothetical protein
VLPYPPNVIGLEVAFVFLYGIVEWVRLRQGAWAWRWHPPLQPRRPPFLPRAPPHPPARTPKTQRTHPPRAVQRRAATAWRAWARSYFHCASARRL